MTKKHFEAVAAAIEAQLTEGRDEWERGLNAGILRTAQGLAKYYAEQNPRFDRQRFLAACGFDCEYV